MDMSSWDGLWQSLLMVVWIVLWGAVVYFAVKVARRPPSGRWGKH